ncbi:MAG: transporter substrate-binding domain-containing protein [Burkholderiales bacterium]|nr:transporter substrate-binding domain-containing protein [Burkholderiales bacterium]
MPHSTFLLQRCCASIVLATLTGFTSPARAAPETECGTIQLAYYELGALFYRSADGSYTGIDKDVVEELERRTTCRFHTAVESRVRIWSQLSTGALDMSVSGIATPEREKFARFIPYFTTRNYVLLHKDVPPAAHSMEGFLADPSLMVAVVKSFRHGPAYDVWLDKLRAQKRVYEAADFDSVMRLFMARRVHAVLALPITFQPFRMREQMNELTLIKDWSPHDKVVHGLIVSRSRVSLANFELLEKTISAMREDGSLENIFQRHIGAELGKQMRYEERKP